MTRGVVRALGIVGLFLFVALPSHAALINLTLQGSPDFYIIDLGITYSAASTKFEAIGATDTYIDPSDSYNYVGDLPSSFNLTAYITGAGMLTNGTVSIEGDTDFDTFAETLLTGNLLTGADGSAFGSTTNGVGLFEFRFSVTGGNVAGDFGGIGATVGVIITPDGSTFGGTWSSDFAASGGFGYADNAPIIPEPSSFFLLALGVALCVATHRSRKLAPVP